MDSQLFVAFLHLDQFVCDNAIAKPVIVYVDGQWTHMSLEAAKYCHAHGIVLYCLLPNATHVQQPCEVGLFGHMRSAWKKDKFLQNDILLACLRKPWCALTSSRTPYIVSKDVACFHCLRITSTSYCCTYRLSVVQITSATWSWA